MGNLLLSSYGLSDNGACASERCSSGDAHREAVIRRLPPSGIRGDGGGDGDGMDCQNNNHCQKIDSYHIGTGNGAHNRGQQIKRSRGVLRLCDHAKYKEDDFVSRIRQNRLGTRIAPTPSVSLPRRGSWWPCRMMSSRTDRKSNSSCSPSRTNRRASKL